MINSFKDKWNDKYMEFAETMDDQAAMDAADEYMSDYMADYGDYLYEQEKDRRMMRDDLGE